MGREANIIPHQFKPGQSGNPNGRKKGSINTKTIIRRWLAATETAVNPLSGEEEEFTQLDIITIKQIDKARKGHTEAFNALLDRIDGRPKPEINDTAVTMPAVHINMPEGVDINLPSNIDGEE